MESARYGLRQSELCTRVRREDPRDEPSLNARLLERAGFVSKLMAGVYSFLPLGVRVLQKIESIVREEMLAAGGQEVLLPALQPAENWQRTGRWDTLDVLFRLKGAGDRDLALGPTHEEVVTPLLQQFLSSYRDLPASVFQIQTKFRNEPRAKSGVLRGREFRMKDMYSFHATAEDLDAYYEKLTRSYHRIFERLGLGAHTVLTYASGGSFSKYSHEFQTLTENGEDIVYVSPQTGLAVNKEVLDDVEDPAIIGDRAELRPRKAIEVGNIFKLMTRFSDAFGFQARDASGGTLPVYMGCYGIGTSRLLGAIVEVLNDAEGIVWPSSVAPFDVHLVNIGRSAEAREVSEQMFGQLLAEGCDVLYDDREGLTAGEKFVESDLIGIPVRALVSDRLVPQERVELKWRGTKETVLVSYPDARARIALGA